jgi:hypothetical protein
MEKSTAPEKIPVKIEELKSLSPEDLSASSEHKKIKSVSGDATRIDLDYVLGGTKHTFWAVVGGQSCSRLVKNDQVTSIIQIAFIAQVVNVQYDDIKKEIERIRPIKIF